MAARKGTNVGAWLDGRFFIFLLVFFSRGRFWWDDGNVAADQWAAVIRWINPNASGGRR
jgi:hypothetical protein